MRTILLIDAGLDAMNVDIKGDADVGRKYCKTIDVEKVWASCHLARSRGVMRRHVHIAIPGIERSIKAAHRHAIEANIGDRDRLQRDRHPVDRALRGAEKAAAERQNAIAVAARIRLRASFENMAASM